MTSQSITEAILIRQPERWAEIKSAPDYAVSSWGRIKRIKDGKTNSKVGKILKTQIDFRGYETAHIRANGKRITRRVHRLVCEAFNGPCPSLKHHVAHGDGNPRNNMHSNLRWATASENYLDKIQHGTAYVKIFKGSPFLFEVHNGMLRPSNARSKDAMDKIDGKVMITIKRGKS